MGNRGHQSRLAIWLGALALAASTAGCPARGIGDPCVPEGIPSNGIDARETYIETNSAQCRTRTCVIFKLDGDPGHVIGETPGCPGGPAHPEGATFDDCIDRAAPPDVANSAARSFCSCRCTPTADAPDAPLCDCTEGFHCIDITSEGGVGLRGGFCVPDVLCTSDDDCASGSCNGARGVCDL